MAPISQRDKNVGLGALESQVLETLQSLQSPGLRLEDLRRLFPRPTADIRSALSRLVAKGRLVRLGRARFYLPTIDPARAACHAWAPSYVSFLTILADAGFTEQIPRRLDLAYAQTILRRQNWHGLPITWHPIPSDAFMGYTTDKAGVLEATPAKAAADLVHRQRDFGGLTAYRPMIEEALRARPRREISTALQAYRNHSGTIRRLLYLRHSDNVPPSARREYLADVDTHNPVPLDPFRVGKKRRAGGLLNILEDSS